jgi:hypothetical protein
VTFEKEGIFGGSSTEHWSQARCVIAATKRNPNALSVSSPIPETNIFQMHNDFDGGAGSTHRPPRAI